MTDNRTTILRLAVFLLGLAAIGMLAAETVPQGWVTRFLADVASFSS